MNTITLSAQGSQPTCVTKAGKCGFEGEIPPLSREQVKPLDHHTTSRDGCRLRSVCRESLRYRIGVDKLVDDQGVPEQLRGARTLSGPVWPGQKHGKWYAIHHRSNPNVNTPGNPKAP
jgi:hypothetical protein